MDLRKPKLSKLLDVPRQHGISGYLAGIETVESVIKETSIKDLYLIPSGPIPPNPSELMATPRFKELLDELKKDLIILLLIRHRLPLLLMHRSYKNLQI